jgi:hypothetical protein
MIGVQGMTPSAPLTADLDRIVDFPWEVLEYLSWLRQRSSSREAPDGYLFEAPRVRFTLAETDLVIAERDIRVSIAASGLRLTAPRAASEVAVEGLDASEREAVERLLFQLDGQAPLGALRARLDAPSERVLDALLGAAFGKLIFAPLAVMTAERAISGIEITRFPGSPYEVARPYWKNMGAVRAAAGPLLEAVDDDQAFVRELRKLHVVLLMGADLQSYYQPASPISSGRAAPGRFMLTPAELIDGPDGVLFVSGPRVAAVPLGGMLYHELLVRSLGRPDAAPLGRADPAKLDWGRLVHARAPTDPAPAPWYCPPRPLHAEHLRALRGSLAAAMRAARAADRSACVAALAAFHQDFVRLHPFHCGNQSLAMNLVNGVLSQALGGGMPHLILDHLAFRLSPEAYARVFRRAVDAYVEPSTSVTARYLRLASNRTRTFELIRQIGSASTLEEALALTQADTTTARLLLLTDD